MLKVFQVCFATGVIFTVLSFIMGRISDFIHMGADTGLDGGLDAGAEADMDMDMDMAAPGEGPELPVSPLKPIVITVFVTVFGGVGMICMGSGFSQADAAAVAAITGAAAAFLLYRFIVVPIYRAQNTSAISRKKLAGALAKVTLAIRDGGFGKISYTAGGNIYSAPARSIDGEDIESGLPVVIINIENNIFYVKRIKGGY